MRRAFATGIRIEHQKNQKKMKNVEKTLNVASNVASKRVKEKTGAEFVGTVVEEYHCGETESEVWRVRKDAWLMSRRT